MSASCLQILALQAPGFEFLLVKVVRFSLEDPPHPISTKIQKHLAVQNDKVNFLYRVLDGQKNTHL